MLASILIGKQQILLENTYHIIQIKLQKKVLMQNGKF